MSFLSGHLKKNVLHVKVCLSPSHVDGPVKDSTLTNSCLTFKKEDRDGCL